MNLILGEGEDYKIIGRRRENKKWERDGVNNIYRILYYV